jgi:cobalamin-dependent methionine synthase I
MPVIHDIPIQLKKIDILRRQGFRGQKKVKDKIEEVIDELLDSLEKTQLLKAAAAYETYPIVEMQSNRIILEGGGVINGELIPGTFGEAVEITTMVCTIGPGLEKQVTKHSRRGEALRGTLLDGIGSAAVDTLAQEVCRSIAREAASRGLQAGSPVNPGMPGLPITEQSNLLALANAKEIGVSLTSSGIMVPRKSTSLIISIGGKMETWSQADICRSCNLAATCPYSVLPKQ